MNHAVHLKAVQDARRAEAEQCCRDVCRWCRDGQRALREVGVGGYWHFERTPDGDMRLWCNGTPIWQRVHGARHG